MHIRGPYGNLKDRYVQSYIGVPFVYVKFQFLLRGDDPNTSSCQYVNNRSHQESQSPTKELVTNKGYKFNRTLGFVSKNTLPVSLPCASPIDMSDHVQYLEVVEAVLQSGVPNYRGVRVPLNSTFNLQYLQEIIALH